MNRRWMALLLGAALAMAADPYAAWAQGRPAEAVQGLIAIANAEQRWDAWLDAGLAAAAADDRGRAVACLVQAHGLAPERAQPRDALRALAAPLPTTWCERAGPLVIPGTGWSGVVILGVAGLAIGAAAGLRRSRGWLLTLGIGGMLVATPGLLATWLDGRITWVATVRDTQALDSTGTPQRALATGTLLQRAATATWSNRVLIRFDDGSLAYVAEVDLDPGQLAP